MPNKDTKKEPSTTQRHVSRVLNGVALAKEFLFTTVFALFTKPPLAAMVLLAAGPVIFITAAVLEVVEYGLTVADAMLVKGEDKAQRAERMGDLVLGFARTAVISAAVVGSLAFKNIFTTKFLGLAGGLTPALFTMAMGAMAVTGFGSSIYNLYKAFKAPVGSDKRYKLGQVAKAQAINATVATVTAVAVGFLMLNPVTGPAMTAVAAVTVTVFVSHLVYTHRKEIGAFFNRVGAGLSRLFASKSPASITRPLLSKGQDQDQVNGVANNQLARSSINPTDRQLVMPSPQAQRVVASDGSVRSSVSSTDEAVTQPASPLPPAQRDVTRGMGQRPHDINFSDYNLFGQNTPPHDRSPIDKAALASNAPTP